MTAVPVTEAKAGDDAAGHIGRTVLVVGVDGSGASWDAFAWAAGEARRCSGRIVAVFVTPQVELGLRAVGDGDASQDSCGSTNIRSRRLLGTLTP